MMATKARKSQTNIILPPPLELLVRSDVHLDCLASHAKLPHGEGLLYRYEEGWESPDFYEVGPRNGNLFGAGLGFDCRPGVRYDPSLPIQRIQSDDSPPSDFKLEFLAGMRRPVGQSGFSRGVYFYLKFAPRQGYDEEGKYKTNVVLLNTSRQTLLDPNNEYHFISYADLRRGAKEILKRTP